VKWTRAKERAAKREIKALVRAAVDLSVFHAALVLSGRIDGWAGGVALRRAAKRARNALAKIEAKP
jgi:hypothetical protein